MTPSERLVTWMLAGFLIGSLLAWALNYDFGPAVTRGMILATVFGTVFLMSRTHKRKVCRERLSPVDGRRR